jgi:hypothetical protein
MNSSVIPKLESSDHAGAVGLEAMKRIAKKIVGSNSGGAVRLRRLLLSAFNGAPVDLTYVCSLDEGLREDLALVILGLNHDVFEDYLIRESFRERDGAEGVAWFVEGLRDQKKGEAK